MNRISSDFEKHTRDYAEEYVKEIASRLRSIAVRVESEAPRMQSGNPLAGVSNVIHEVVWGTANLGLETLVTRGDDILTAIRQGLQEQVIETSPIQVGEYVSYTDEKGKTFHAWVEKLRYIENQLFADLASGADLRFSLPISELKKLDQK